MKIASVFSPFYLPHTPCLFRPKHSRYRESRFHSHDADKPGSGRYGDSVGPKFFFRCQFGSGHMDGKRLVVAKGTGQKTITLSAGALGKKTIIAFGASVRSRYFH